jgi:hypothetical protein
MKTASDYRNQFNISTESDDTISSRCDDIEAAINEARKDTIIECADRAETDGHPESGYWVDRQSIIQLIKELL